MSIFTRGKKESPTPTPATAAKAKPTTAAPSRAEATPAPKKEAVSAKAKPTAVRGTSVNAYQVLLKPLVTEKAADLGTHNQYVFMIDPRMNKIEVKKAIRTIYGINPLAVRIITMQGKAVRYGRRYGVTKNWKKAMVTLKAGDKIEVYEGV